MASVHMREPWSKFIDRGRYLSNIDPVGQCRQKSPGNYGILGWCGNREPITYGKRSRVKCSNLTLTAIENDDLA